MSVTTLATIFFVSRRMQSASGQYMMQRRHPFFATHFSSVTTATLYMRRPFLRSRSRNHQLDVILSRPFGPEFVGLFHHRQVLGEQQFLLREFLRNRLIEVRLTADAHEFLPKPILYCQVQSFHRAALGNSADEPDNAHVVGKLVIRILERVLV